MLRKMVRVLQSICFAGALLVLASDLYEKSVLLELAVFMILMALAIAPEMRD